MTPMTKEQLAQLLNGREYGSEINGGEEIIAKKDGLLVIFGYSDDNVELRGAFNDEAGCYDGGTIYLSKTGLLPSHEEDCECNFCGYEKAAAKAVKIDCHWSGDEGYSWTYETIIPHAKFDIIEDGKKFCRGIVLCVADLPEI